MLKNILKSQLAGMGLVFVVCAGLFGSGYYAGHGNSDAMLGCIVGMVPLGLCVGWWLNQRMGM